MPCQLCRIMSGWNDCSVNDAAKLSVESMGTLCYFACYPICPFIVQLTVVNQHRPEDSSVQFQILPLLTRSLLPPPFSVNYFIWLAVVCLCVCLHVHVCVHVCVYVFVCVWCRLYLLVHVHGLAYDCHCCLVFCFFLTCPVLAFIDIFVFLLYSVPSSGIH